MLGEGSYLKSLFGRSARPWGVCHPLRLNNERSGIWVHTALKSALDDLLADAWRDASDGSHPSKGLLIQDPHVEDLDPSQYLA